MNDYYCGNRGECNEVRRRRRTGREYRGELWMQAYIGSTQSKGPRSSVGILCLSFVELLIHRSLQRNPSLAIYQQCPRISTEKYRLLLANHSTSRSCFDGINKVDRVLKQNALKRTSLIIDISYKSLRSGFPSIDDDLTPPPIIVGPPARSATR